jgi:hypothetical protein
MNRVNGHLSPSRRMIATTANVTTPRPIMLSPLKTPNAKRGTKDRAAPAKKTALTIRPPRQ